MSRVIIIPETKIFGWESIEGKTDKIFKPTSKSIWNRIAFIAKEYDCSVEKITTGFTLKSYSYLSDIEKVELNQLLQREIELMKGLNEERDVPLNLTDEGRESPELENSKLI